MIFFAFGVQFFWYRLVFLSEIIIAEALFTFKLRRRPRFAMRAALCAVCLYVLVFCMPVLSPSVAQSAAWYLPVIINCLTFIVLFGLTILALYACYAEALINVIFCALAAYATQHLAYELYSLIITASGLSNGMQGAYGYGGIPTEYNGFTAIVYLDGYAIVYFLMYVFFGRRIKKNSELHLKNIVVVGVATLTLIVVVFFNAIILQRVTERSDMLVIYITYVYDIICCLFVISIQFGLNTSNSIKNELDIIRRLRTKEHEQYMISKENIDLINLKCHDLKHQLTRLGAQGRLDENVRSEIEHAVEIYDSVIKTGNDALDVILTEKGLLCNKNGIKLACMADGTALDFMSSSDLYSLFGNALDNAIEAVKKVEDRNKHTISFVVRKKHDFVSVNINNYYANDVTVVDGLPVTTKEDRRFHGYGLKSIRLIVEKYDGDLSFLTVDGVFYLNILFQADSGRS